MKTKPQWRHEARERREQNLDERPERDSALCEHLANWVALMVPVGGVVVLFDALPGEADLSRLRSSNVLAARGIVFGITRTPDVGFDLTVHPADSEMERHRFGYSQPVATAPVLADSRVDAVLVPALAFDIHGNRLGFGAGYYDRFLARLPRALRVGVADVLVAEVLPVESFDIPMTHLGTIEGVSQVT